MYFFTNGINMLKKIVINFFIISIVTALLFAKRIGFIEINKILPDLLLIFTVFNGFYYGSTYGMFFGFFSGLAFDVCTYSLLGFWALIYCVIGYLTGVSKIIYIDNPLISSIVLLLFNILKYFIYILIGLMFINSDSVFNYVFHNFLIETLYTILISIPIFLIYKYFDKKLRNPRSNV